MLRSTVAPKPILKQPSPVGTPCNSVPKRAHFPPPNEEAIRYSGIEYDRTPISVIANELELPARGCPGRTFDGDEDYPCVQSGHHLKKSSKSGKATSGDHVHPNFFVAAASSAAGPNAAAMAGSATMPPLSMSQGDSSESSDGDVSSPPVSDLDATVLPGSPTGGDHHSKRLRKARPSDIELPRHSQSAFGHHHANRFHPSADLPPPSPGSSAFASCPGSNSCLGGF